MGAESAMTELIKQRCEACNADAPKVSDEELRELIRQIPCWAANVRDGILMLEREFGFKNFKQAMAFSVQVGMLAEAEGHHPEITTEWGKVKVAWWSHKIKGLHRNDFICAAKTDKLFA